MSDRFITREEGVQLVREQLGIPLTLSMVEKEAHKRNAPEPAAKYGKRLLYRPDAFLRWAEGLIQKMEAA